MLVSAQFAKNLKTKRSKEKQVWTTPGGSMTTSTTVKTQFTIPELHDSRMIEGELHVTKDLGAHDMIIGRDLRQFLEIDVLFSTLTVEWEGADMPFKDVSAPIYES